MKEVSVLRKLLEDSVKKSCSEKTGIVFSAGVDSTLIAFIARKFSDVIAYTVGTNDSEDVYFAKRFSEMNFFPVKIRKISLDDLKENFLVVEEILRKNNIKLNELNFSTSFPIYFASMAASEDGIKIMLSGQGGDELFGGYSRYLKMSDEEKINFMAKDTKNSYKDNLKRDCLMCEKHDVVLKFPYLDDKFVDYALSLPLDLRIKEVTDRKKYLRDFEGCVDEVNNRKYIRKYILRKLAEDVGVPEYIAKRKKRAMQYGSETQKILKKYMRWNLKSKI